MTAIERLEAMAAIRQAKARYLRGVDTGDGNLVRSVLAADCVLDYRGCCTDPASGVDYLPQMNIVMRGRDAWATDNLDGPRIVSAHHGHDHDISFADDGSAAMTCAFTDRLYMPPGAPYGVMVGFGYYHETYVREDGGWKISTLRIERIRVETR